MTFLYFGYGSNLSSERIRICNKTAKFVTVAKLKGYTLHFCGYSTRWHGGGASIKPSQDDEVWGVVWRLEDSDRPNIDMQENNYDSCHIKVESSDETEYSCLTYISKNSSLISNPSVSYKTTIIHGAVEHSLPEQYICRLREIQDNGNNNIPTAGVLSFIKSK
ncbi:GGCT (predicted) [Pycnogonum litorale]